MWCPMMPAHSWRMLLGSPRAYGVKTPPINPNYAGEHRLSSLIRVIVLSTPRRHQPRGVAVRRSVIDRVARLHRCRHGHVHAHPSDRDHAEPNGHRQLTRQRGRPQLLMRVGVTTAAGEQQLPPPPTTRDRGSAVPQLALPAASGSHHLRVRPATRGEGRRRSSILCPSDCDPWSMVNLGHQ